MAVRWQSPRHVAETLQYALYTPSNLVYLGCGNENPDHEQQLTVGRNVSSTRAVCCQRVWSLAARHSLPPDAYAPIYSNVAAERQSTSLCMKRHWANLLYLEHRRNDDSAASELWLDTQVPQSYPIRLMFNYVYIYVDR